MKKVIIKDGARLSDEEIEKLAKKGGINTIILVSVKGDDVEVQGV